MLINVKNYWDILTKNFLKWVARAATETLVNQPLGFCVDVLSNTGTKALATKRPIQEIVPHILDLGAMTLRRGLNIVDSIFSSTDYYSRKGKEELLGDKFFKGYKYAKESTQAGIGKLYSSLSKGRISSKFLYGGHILLSPLNAVINFVNIPLNYAAKLSGAILVGLSTIPDLPLRFQDFAAEKLGYETMNARAKILYHDDPTKRPTVNRQLDTQKIGNPRVAANSAFSYKTEIECNNKAGEKRKVKTSQEQSSLPFCSWLDKSALAYAMVCTSADWIPYRDASKGLAKKEQRRKEAIGESTGKEAINSYEDLKECGLNPKTTFLHRLAGISPELYCNTWGGKPKTHVDSAIVNLDEGGKSATKISTISI